ncbi:DUF3558 family protein [Amycolatopsis albispora]|uniref:DUF3558 family protein n=1 Tax=Amycolatopsis albispora TaxID=1804986 RepID=UPI001F3551CA|nr:DUF3558 family protein [Amycolatopsis albispora]
MVLAACSPKPEAPQPEPPTPVVLGAPVPIPAVGLNVGGLREDPCRAFTPAQQVTLNYIATEEEWHQPWHAGTGYCVWTERTAQFSVSVREESAAKAFEFGRRTLDEMSVSGLPVLIETNPALPDKCQVTLGAAPNFVIVIGYESRKGARFWTNDSCGGAFKAAEFLTRNFRG